MEHMDNRDCTEGILKLKDKYSCRVALKPLYPKFRFCTMALKDLPKFDIKAEKIVIKPRKGFFGAGVRIVERGANLNDVAQDIRREVLEKARFFPESVLSKEEFVAEEYIEGEEYAVDMYYDHLGKPTIMNIYKHPEAMNKHYDHLMYYSNKSLFDAYLPTFENLFHKLGEALQLVSFPIHAEFKLHNGEFVPIEFNPMRFGGFGLSDLTYFSFGFQPISFYFGDQHTDWYEMWQSRGGTHYAFILAYNSAKVDSRNMQPNHDKLWKYLTDRVEIINYVKLDYREYPVFAIAYVKSDDENELLKLLSFEFDDFFS